MPKVATGHARERQMAIRPYAESDLVPLVSLFTDAVHALAASRYDQAQLDAWAPTLPDLEAWALRFASVSTLVAEVGTERAGFISYESNGHVDLLYTSPAYCRRGVASMLCKHVEAALVANGRTEVFTEASLIARPFFEHHGFRVTEEQSIRLRGAMFRRFGMRKAVGS